MPSSKVKVRKRRQRKQEYSSHDEEYALPSHTLIDEGVQVSNTLMANVPVVSKHNSFLHPINSTSAKTGRSFFPNLFEIPPEEIRCAILNQGETYWESSMNCSILLAIGSTLQLLIFFIAFGIIGHHRNILALLPTRYTVISWFLIMFGGDIFILFIIKFGKFVSEKYSLTREADRFFVLLATIVLFVNFLASIAFPACTTPFLWFGGAQLHSHSAECLQVRDEFNEAGTEWNSIAILRELCEHHSPCLESCRDFRSIYFWLYATYVMTAVRFVVLIPLWNVASFLGMISGFHE